jgi:hypothetical protein
MNKKCDSGETVAKGMWGLMWVGRTLIFPMARKLLKNLVAGEGFEPSTFGLWVR